MMIAALVFFLNRWILFILISHNLCIVLVNPIIVLLVRLFIPSESLPKLEWILVFKIPRTLQSEFTVFRTSNTWFRLSLLSYWRSLCNSSSFLKDKSVSSTTMSDGVSLKSLYNLFEIFSIYLRTSMNWFLLSSNFRFYFRSMTSSLLPW